MRLTQTFKIMEFEFDKKAEGFSASENESSREGYRSSEQSGNNQGYRTPGRSPRPRFTSRQQGGYDRQQGGYERQSHNHYNDDRGFRPEGFGANLQGGDQPRQYRPRYNGEGGYQRQGGYQNRQGGYQQRGGYNQNRQGGYRPRYNEGGEQQEGGYNNNYQSREGGFQQREGGYQQRQGGYRPRYNGEGGYQQRQGGGYQQGGYNNGGRGGYNKNGRPGGYRQRTADYDPHAKYSMKKRIQYKEEHYDPNEPIRLNKFLANAGVCSRREADEYIQAGVITVNGVVVTELGTKVMRTDEIKFHDQPVMPEKKVYVLLNKPKDYVTTSDDPQQRKIVMDLVKDACSERIYPVGRLDRNTTGVLLLTNDGDMASKLTHPKFLKKKIYHVYCDKNVTAHDLQQIRDGIELEDGEIKADAVEYADAVDKKQVGIEIHSGKNRIVRRIFESLGYKVTKLDRVQFAGLTKKNLRRGDWRYLTEEEVDRLRMGAYE